MTNGLEGCPKEVSAEWDHSGLTIQLPGASWPFRRLIRDLFVLTAVIELMVLLILVVGRPLPVAQWGYVFLALPLVLFPLALLGTVRGRGTPITVRIEPQGGLSYAWLAEPWQLSIAEIQSIEVPRIGAPRIEVQSKDTTQNALRFRTWDQANWVAEQLRAAKLRESARHGSEEEVRLARQSLEGVKPS